MGFVNLSHQGAHQVEVISKGCENGTLSFVVDTKTAREVHLQFMKIHLPQSGRSDEQISATTFKQIREGAWTHITCLGTR